MLFDQTITSRITVDHLEIETLNEKTRLSFRAKEGDFRTLDGAGRFPLIEPINRFETYETCISAHIAPDEWILMGEVSDRDKMFETLERSATGIASSIVDISHRNIGFQVSGLWAAQAINIGCPLDLSLSSFPVGKATRSVFENAQILLLREEETRFRLECWRSYAPYIIGFFEKFITNAAARK